MTAPLSGAAGNKNAGADPDREWWRAPGPRPRSGEVFFSDARGTPGYAVAFWSLVAFTVILLLAPQQQFPILAPLRIALLSVAVAVLATGYNRLSRGMPILQFSPDVVLLLLLTFWAALMIPFSFWPGGSVEFFLQNYLKAAIGFLLISHAVSDFRQLWSICWCLVLCTVPLSLVTLANFATGRTMESADDRVLGYSAGLTANPNDLALMLNLILPLSIALLLGSRSSVKKLLLAGIAVLMVTAVIATFSRAGFLTLVFIGACYAWLLRRRRERIFIPVVLILGMFALPLVPTTYFDRVETILNIEQDETGSAQTRLSDMKVAVSLALANPIVGSGIGMSTLAMNEARGPTWVVVHNVYLQIAVDLGLPGMLLFILLLLQCIRVTRQVSTGRADHPIPEQLRLVAEALSVSLLAFAVSAIFYPVAYNFYFYYFAGMAIAAGRIYRAGTGASKP